MQNSNLRHVYKNKNKTFLLYLEPLWPLLAWNFEKSKFKKKFSQVIEKRKNLCRFQDSWKIYKKVCTKSVIDKKVKKIVIFPFLTYDQRIGYASWYFQKYFLKVLL
jgi:hypothetical protein